MKYIINYVLFMAICAVISLFYKNDVHSPSKHSLKTSHNIISDSTNTDYWGLQTDLLPAVMNNSNQALTRNALHYFGGNVVLEGSW